MDDRGSNPVNVLVSIAAAVVVAGYLFPLVFEFWTDADTSGYSNGLQALWEFFDLAIVLILVLGLVMYAIYS